MICKIDSYFKRNKDYSIRDLAFFTGVSTQTVYGYLDSKIIPSLPKAILVRNFFNMVNQYRAMYPEVLGVEDLWIMEEKDLKD